MNTQDDKKTITIKEAVGFPEGTPIPRITGTLTHVFDRKTGEGDYGPYSSQSGVIEQDGSKILFTVWNKPTIPEDYKGRLLVFRSGTGKKPSMTLKNDFKDATKRTLNVTKSCFVMTEEEDKDDIPMDYPPKAPSIQPSYDERKQDVQGEMDKIKAKNASKPIVDPKKSIHEDGLDKVRHRLMQYVNLRKLTDSAAEALYGQEQHADNKKDVSSCFFIQALREGLADKLTDSKQVEVKAKKIDLEEEDPEFLPAEEF